MTISISPLELKGNPRLARLWRYRCPDCYSEEIMLDYHFARTNFLYGEVEVRCCNCGLVEPIRPINLEVIAAEALQGTKWYCDIHTK